MGRYLAIYFPYWAVDLQRRRQRQSQTAQALRPTETPLARKPLLLFEKHGQQLVVKHACELAWRRGVRAGMPLSFASMLLKEEPCSCAYDAASDFQALLKVAQWCARLSPLVGVDSALVQHYRASSLAQASVLDHGLIIDLRGTERVHRGFETLLNELQQRFVHSGVRLLMACAPSIAGAWALSRFAAGEYAQASHCAAAAAGQYFIVREFTNLKRLLLPLPLECLRISQEVQQQLQALGVCTLEQLFALPRRSLGLRYGIELLRRMDQLLGALPEALLIPRQQVYFRAQQRFETPLERQESLAQATLTLLEDVLLRLQQAKRQASSFVLQWYYRDTEFQQQLVHKELSLQHASAQPEHIRSIIMPLLEPSGAAFSRVGSAAREKSERMHLPSGSNGVECIVVIARCTKRVESEQYVFEEVRDTPATATLDRSLSSIGSSSKQQPGTKERMQQLFNTLTSRLGQGALAHVCYQASHVPEKSFVYKAIQKTPSTTDAAIAQDSIVQGSLVQCFGNRPSRLFDTPEPVQVIALLPDKPPASFIWRGQRFRVLRGIGPERIQSEWWQAHGQQYTQAEERDYFSVLDESGRWLWLYRENTKQGSAVSGPCAPMAADSSINNSSIHSSISTSSIKWFAHGVWE